MRLTADYLILGSDAGRIVVLEYNAAQRCFQQVHEETFGRSGNRRIVPGQFLAADPKGRAVMIGAVEKAKLIYVLNRDAEARLTISSPLEAHRASTIVQCMVGVDVGYENPLYASLEMDYAEADADPSGEAARTTDKMLTYYELDLGLNHVIRRWSQPVDRSAHHLIAVPGGYNHVTERWDGPSGVLVCTGDHVVYQHQGQPSHSVPIPRRPGSVERGSMVVASVLHRMKTSFFVLIQNEDGDLFKVTVDYDDEDVTSLRIKYFDTVPVAASLLILRAGFLYVAAESGPQLLYSFQQLGDNDDVPEYVSTELPEQGMQRPLPLPSFVPRPLENLALAHTMDALDPLMDARISNTLQQDVPQIFAACGRAARSSFKRLRHGLEVQDVVSSELPGVPEAVWSTKLRQNDAYDGYIVLSFLNGTLVLSIGDTIEEVVDSGFLTSAPTLAVQQLGADALVQVHPRGIRHILASKQVNEWGTPLLEDGTPTSIVAATTNERQVVVALDSHEIVYFELDMDGQLNEYQERRDIGASIITMSMAACPTGSQRTPYVALGCEDQTVRVFSLEPDSTLAPVSLQALTAPPSSICITEMLDASLDPHHLTMFVSIGMTNGVYIRTVLDPATGQLTDTRTRFLGSRPVKLVRASTHGDTAVVALSSRSWLSYTLHAHIHFTPLMLQAPLTHVASFSTELCPDGLLGIVGDQLRIFTVPTLGGDLKMDSLPLSYTPRKMAVHPSDPRTFFVVEADHRVLGAHAPERTAATGDLAAVMALDPAQYGPVRAAAGRWASCVRVVDGTTMSTVQHVELDDDEAAVSVAVLPFSATGDGLHVVVGSVVGMVPSPRSCRTAYLTTYKLQDDGRTLKLLHKTEVDDVPLALHAFHGRLLAGVGRYLRIYDMGTKKLLRKCQSKPFSTQIVSLNVQGFRVVVGEMQESVHFVMYKQASNALVSFADDTMPRWTTATLMLDYDTVMAGDKFGNVYVLRIDSGASAAADEDPTGLMLQNERAYLMGAAHRAQLMAFFHIGDIITSLSLESMVPGGRPIVVYTCVNGAMGALVPFISRADVSLFTALEMHLRQEHKSLVGRDHLAYRGQYAAVKAVVDGDLCELFTSLSPEKQGALADTLGRTPSEIAKKLAQMRETTTGF